MKTLLLLLVGSVAVYGGSNVGPPVPVLPPGSQSGVELLATPLSMKTFSQMTGLPKSAVGAWNLYGRNLGSTTVVVTLEDFAFACPSIHFNTAEQTLALLNRRKDLSVAALSGHGAEIATLVIALKLTPWAGLAAPFVTWVQSRSAAAMPDMAALSTRLTQALVLTPGQKGVILATASKMKNATTCQAHQ